MSEPITAEWLASVGFKWHQMERQPDKHWLLWLGGVERQALQCVEDLGIQLAPVRNDGDDPRWFCWLRADTAGRYSRFLHTRYLRTQDDVKRMVEVLTGQPWDPANHLWGSVRTPEEAARIRQEDERPDRRMLLGGRPWAACEKDATRGGALPEHLEEHVQRREGRRA